MSHNPLRRLSQAQVDQFRLNGFLSVEDVLTTAEVEQVAAQADLIAAGKADHIPDTSVQLERIFREGKAEVKDQVLAVRKLYDLAVYDQTMWSHVCNPKVVDIITDLLGVEDIKMYGDQLFMKAAETGTAQPWHQDSASWRDILPMDLVTAWTALDEATEENGCLHFIPGTHRWGMMQAGQTEPIKADFGGPRWPVVAAPLRPGSISFHHSLTLHMSKANSSGQRRRGYAVHYMRASSWKDERVTNAPKMPPFKQVQGDSLPGRV
jgi:phytanoyl-CoA hydroxylase